MECEYCEIAQHKGKAEILFEDQDIIIAIKDTAAIAGQITIFPKNHFTILEMVPDAILKRCASLSNAVSTTIFETMGCQGTNIIIQNGLGAGQKVPHFAVEVLPRREGDGLNLQWEPKQLSEDEMSTAYLMLKEEGDKIVNVGKESKAAPVVVKSKEEKKVIKAEGSGKDNYLLKSLRKMP